MSINDPTPNIGLEDQATGANPTTWGDRADANFHRIDAAFGFAEVDVTGGDVTLTVVDSADTAADMQVRPAVIAAAGTPVVPRAVIWPVAKVRLYLLLNKTAQVVTFKVAGQSGLAVAAGSWVLAFAGGVDIGVADTSVVNQAVVATLAPLASPAFSGSPTAPTQAGGDNSGKLATTGYADQAVGVEAAARITAVAGEAAARAAADNAEAVARANADLSLASLSVTHDFGGDVPATRALGVTYTNSAARAKAVMVGGVADTSPAQFDLFINGVRAQMTGLPSGGNASGCVVVPPGATYMAAFSAGTGHLGCWAETY